MMTIRVTGSPEPENERPTVTITSPITGTTAKGIVWIMGTSEDRDGEVETVEISIQGGKWTRVTETSPWNYQWDTTGLLPGEYAILVRSHDGTDHSEEGVLTLSVVEEKEESSEDGFLPAFTLWSAVGAISLALIFRRYRNRSHKNEL